jgi:PTH1 family peptidyl-tRNA hydrolase
MKLIVGLGNPGKKYELTRHNAGFVVMDYYAKQVNVPISKVKFKSYYNEVNIAGEKVILMKPQTYMNLSGEAVASAVKYYNLEMSDVLVIYDDIDIDFGKLRIRKQGSAGTHNGMRSIIYQLKSDDFARIRVGIGRDGDQALHDYVLRRFPKGDWDQLKDVVTRAGDAIDTFIRDGIDAAMNRYNG